MLYRGQDFWAGTESERQKLLSGVGLLFQSGALWSSMTLAENVALPLQRYTKLSSAEIREQTSLKLALGRPCRDSRIITRPKSAAVCANAPARPRAGDGPRNRFL